MILGDQTSTAREEPKLRYILRTDDQTNVYIALRGGGPPLTSDDRSPDRKNGSVNCAPSSEAMINRQRIVHERRVAIIME